MSRSALLVVATFFVAADGAGRLQELGVAPARMQAVRAGSGAEARVPAVGESVVRG